MESSPRRLVLIGSVSCVIYGILWAISGEFRESIATVDRPIVWALSLFALAFGLYFWAIREARQLPNPIAWPILVSFAVVFRGLLLLSEPIQEVDIYRYIWDGHVTAAGVNPYQFSPTEVKAAVDANLAGDLATVAKLARDSVGLQEILRRVHFADLRSPYPPTSQAVFAVSAVLSPNSASAVAHVRMMKFLIVLFDLAALVGVLLILRHLQKPLGFAVAYGWCPLVMKEFANSGHLDSIAVCLTVFAVYFFVRTIYPNEMDRKGHTRDAILASIFLGLAVGAKYFPLVLSPLFLVIAWRNVSVRKTLLSALVFLATTGICLAPTISAVVRGHLQSEAGEPNGDGLTAFLESWEINDFLFMVVVENLKTNQDLGDQPRAWFSVFPKGIQKTIRGWSVATFDERGRLQAFFTTRAIMGLVYCGVLAWLMLLCWKEPSSKRFLAVVFLAIAWFWLLSPTQNPWYWTWALPFVCFSKSRAWLAISAVTMLYYLRFWFGAHYPSEALLGTPYSGTWFFDFCLPWVEFLPILVWLGVETVLAKKSRHAEPESLHL